MVPVASVTMSATRPFGIPDDDRCKSDLDRLIEHMWEGQIAAERARERFALQDWPGASAAMFQLNSWEVHSPELEIRRVRQRLRWECARLDRVDPTPPE
jgi:hypothetical protein